MPDETKRKSKMEIAAETSKKSREMHGEDLSHDDVEKILNDAKKTVDDVERNNQAAAEISTETKQKDSKSEKTPEKKEKSEEKKKEAKAENDKQVNKSEDKKKDVKDEKTSEDKKTEVKDEKASGDKKTEAKDEKTSDNKKSDIKDEKKPEEKKDDKKPEKQEVKKEDKKPIEEAVIIKEKRSIDAGKFFKVAGLVLLGLVALTYGVGCVYFNDHFQANTRVNGVEASYLAGEDIISALNEQANDYSITVSGRGDISVDILGEKIDFHAEPAGDIKDVAKAQRFYMWPLSFFENSDLKLSYKDDFDSDKLGRTLATSRFFDGDVYRLPADAYIDFVDGEFTIIPEDNGAAPIKKKLTELVSKAVSDMESSVSLADSEAYKKPEILSDDEELVKRCKALAEYNECSLTYLLGGVEYEIPPEELTEALYFDNGGHLSIDSEKIKRLVSKLATEFNTADTVRSFVTQAGYTVYVKGPYGFKIDEEQEFDSIYEQLRLRKKVTREPVYAKHGYARKGVKNDVGDSYVEIDLEKQHLYLFIDGKLYLESDVVTGNVSHKCATPPGIYGIDYKKTPAILRGDDYESHVTYWMPFNRGIGLHDATWRGRFGGNIYQYNGSHGCVNLPLKNAKEIYSVVKIGMPVILYNSSSYIKQ